LELQKGITREVIETLIEHKLPFTVLTKSANVLRDKDLLKSYNKCRVGLSIVTLNEDLKQLLEPNSSTIANRINALKELKQAGISTYCSIEPILPDKRSDPIAIIEVLKDYIDLFEFGKWNPKRNSQRYVEKILGTVYDEEYYLDVFRNIEKYCNEHSIKYCHAGHSEPFLNNHKMTFKPYPTVLD
jgi:DNA repair photolyase